MGYSGTAGADRDAPAFAAEGGIAEVRHPVPAHADRVRERGAFGFGDELWVLGRTPTATTNQAAAPVSDLVYVTPRFGGYGLLCHSARG